MASAFYRPFPDEFTTSWEWDNALEKFKKGERVIFVKSEQSDAERGEFIRYAGNDKDGHMVVDVKCGEGFYWTVPFTGVSHEIL